VDQVLAMAAFSLTMSCTPGPNNIMLAASGVNFGFARTLPHMTGVSLGFVVMLAACAAGLGTLFTLFPAVHIVLKIVGAVYLLWLAWKVANAGGPDEMKDADARPLTFLQAAAFQWVNPKAVLACLGAVTLFVRPLTAVPDTLVMLTVFFVATVISVVIWAGFGTLVSRLLRNPRHAQIFNIVMALLLVASIVPMVL
jgi:threonine/homoserine/homoserine lactone efflux protein